MRCGPCGVGAPTALAAMSIGSAYIPAAEVSLLMLIETIGKLTLSLSRSYGVHQLAIGRPRMGRWYTAHAQHSTAQYCADHN